ncbi:MAG: hypothetical protein JEZ01_20475 [Labilibaculum sp.]|nr:hypothetical protein [Labilibaculum sp.]MBI9060155.1 hypothetical protein [Labilibaculum sp.]
MSQLIQQPVKAVECNSISGSYRPIYFDLEAFKVSRAELNSIFYNSEEDSDPELALLRSSFSFAYLREDKLRTIDVYDVDGKHISFNDFLDRFSISIKSNNLFKSGKYLSRVFRPVKHGGFYKDLDIHIKYFYMNPFNSVSKTYRNKNRFGSILLRHDPILFNKALSMWNGEQLGFFTHLDN